MSLFKNKIKVIPSISHDVGNTYQTNNSGASQERIKSYLNRWSRWATVCFLVFFNIGYASGCEALMAASASDITINCSDNNHVRYTEQSIWGKSVFYLSVKYCSDKYHKESCTQDEGFISFLADKTYVFKNLTDPNGSDEYFATTTDASGTPATPVVYTFPITIDTDATLTASSTIEEPVNLPSTADTTGEAVNLFDFTINDGGGGDGFSTDVSQILLRTSGTADFSKVTWRLNGANVSEVVGVYDNGANTLTFNGLTISVANGGNETYTLSGYYSTPTGLTDNATYIFSVDGDTDLTVDSAKTQMGTTTPVTNGTGTKVDITATKFRFRSPPSNESLL